MTILCIFFAGVLVGAAGLAVVALIVMGGPMPDPIPPFTRCPSCGGVAMRIMPGKPVTCANCGREE